MGIIRKGILGGFRKKTGTVVGVAYRNKDVIKSLPRASSKKATSKQIAQRKVFGMVTSYLSNFGAFIDVGFRLSGSDTSPMNDAVAYHLAEAITGTGLNVEIDHTKLKFSRGKRELPHIMEVKLSANLAVEFTWQPRPTEDKFNHPLDQVTLVVYNPVKNIVIGVNDAALRSAGKATLVMPGLFTGDELYCYISFNSVTSPLMCSNSRFIGKLTLV